MKTNRRLTLIAYVEVFLALLSVDLKSESGASRLALDPDFARFVREKKALTTTLAKKHEVTVPSMVWQFFDAAEKGDWETTTNSFARLLASPGG